MDCQVIAGQGRRNELIVILHGLTGAPARMRGMVAAAQAERPNADIFIPRLPFAGPLGMFSLAAPEQVAADVARCIGKLMDERAGAYQRIVLTGHSIGAVIARKVAILAHGEIIGARFEAGLEAFQAPQPWSGKIERIVLLAGMSRGWSPATARSWLLSAWWTIGAGVAEFLTVFTRRSPTFLGIRQGAPFIVQTRLQWLALAKSAAIPAHRDDHQAAGAEPAADAAGARDGRVIVIQLLGAVDDMVSPEDSVDFAVDTYENAPFGLIELPFTTHVSAFDMRAPSAEQRREIEQAIAQDARPPAEADAPPCCLADLCKRQGLAAETRWVIFGRSLSRSLDALADLTIKPDHMMDMPAAGPEGQVEHVVFVIHGIRDRGFWTQKIARAIKREAERQNERDAADRQRAGLPAQADPAIRSFTGSYGYFAMVPFVFPWVRRWKTAWLMDRYTEVRARYPQAAFSYVGHSNGTYLLARALRDYPAVRFRRVVFAGSVVRRDYDWKRLLEPDRAGEPSRVTEVLNYVATGDWVVAIFSKAFQPLKFLFDLGSAGHDGFRQAKRPKPPPARLHESRFVIGSHSAAIAETQWDDIARFVVAGRLPAVARQDPDFARRRGGLMVLFGWLSPLVLMFLVWLVIGFGTALFHSVTGSGVVQVAANVWSIEDVARQLSDAGCRTFKDIPSCAPDVAAAVAEWALRSARRLVADLGASLAVTLQGSLDALRAVPDWLWQGARAVPGALAGAFTWAARSAQHLIDIAPALPGMLGAALVSVIDWLLAVVQGRISTPFAAAPESIPAAAGRAVVFAAYCGAVYLAVTRF